MALSPAAAEHHLAVMSHAYAPGNKPSSLRLKSTSSQCSTTTASARRSAEPLAERLLCCSCVQLGPPSSATLSRSSRRRTTCPSVHGQDAENCTHAGRSHAEVQTLFEGLQRSARARPGGLTMTSAMSVEDLL